MSYGRHDPRPERDAFGGDGQEFLGDLLRAAGPEDYRRLLSACGGRRVYVPRRAPGRNSWLSIAVGQERAAEIIAEMKTFSVFCQSYVEVPARLSSDYNVRLSENSRLILAGYLAGKSTSMIAAECTLTRRGVQQHLRKLRATGKLPVVDPLLQLAEPYFGGAGSFSRAIRRHADGEAPAAGFVMSADERETIEALAEEFAASEARSGADRTRAVRALIEKAHGKDVLDRVCALSGSRKISFRADLLASSAHPLRQVLAEREAKLLAVAIHAAGLTRAVELDAPAAPSEPRRRRGRRPLFPAAFGP